MNTKTKTGAASLYVVIFTTLLLGIITLGFIRIMLSEAIQTSNNDLSQSAFDSALAGIEDAKVLLLKYHECLNGDATTVTSEDCDKIINAIQAPNSASNCDIVRGLLFGREAGDQHETIIQSSDGTGDEMEQAYTCVLISETNPDYLGQLNSSYHSKMIPIRTTDLPTLNQLNYIRLDWYSTTNADQFGYNLTPPDSELKSNNKPADYEDKANTGLLPALDNTNPTTPPALGVQFFQTDPSFRYDQLSVNSNSGTDRGSLFLVPTNDPRLAAPTIVESNTSTGFTASADKAINLPIPIRCQPSGNPEGASYYCTAILGIPKPFGGGSRNESSTFLRVFLPYGTPDTDFSVALCNNTNPNSCTDSANIMPFLGVQARIDATGRANDLFRRVEARVELVDVYFPYPEYVAAITSTKDALNKNFWVTSNNWNGYDSGYITTDQY